MKAKRKIVIGKDKILKCTRTKRIIKFQKGEKYSISDDNLYINQGTNFSFMLIYSLVKDTLFGSSVLFNGN